MSVPERFAPARVLRRFAALPDPAMRAAVWREAFEHLEVDHLLDLMVAVIDRLDQGDTAGRTAWLALVQVEPPEPLQAALAERARQRDLPRLVGLFIRMPEPEAVDPADIRGAPLDPERTITLGERVSWARRPDRALLERLLFDPSERVIARLLDNPKVTEDDVLRIASRRPNLPSSLAVVFAHPRWGQRTEVQLALILNPHTPLRIACGLIGMVDIRRARDIAKQPAAHPLVRAAARHRAEGGRG